MSQCEFCHAPLLSITKVCPNCGREQPPYPPVLPGGGGSSYRGWAYTLFSFAAGLMLMGVVLFIQTPFSDVAAYSYGSPDSYVVNNKAAWITIAGAPIYPGYGYLIFFGGFAVILFAWGLVSISRGGRIDAANSNLLRSLRRRRNGR